MVHQINSLLEVLKLKNKFQKNKVVTIKTAFFVVGSFCTSILFVLTLASDKATFYRNVLFSISATSNKRQYSNFWKKAFIFQKICFRVKVMKTFKISFDFHVKTYRSLKRRTILKIPGTVFKKSLCSFCLLQILETQNLS